jgi:hypothetical protein
MLKRCIILLSLLVMPGLFTYGHKFYTSMTQVEYNDKTRSAEVIMNVFTDDLEIALSSQFNRKIKSSDKDFTSLCYQYISGRFQVKDSQNHLLKNEYAGLEFNRDMVSIYLEVKLPQGLSDTRFRQATLLEAFRDQTNIVNFRSGKSRTSLVFRAGTPDVQTVKFGS